MTTLLTKILRALDAASEVEQQATPVFRSENWDSVTLHWLQSKQGASDRRFIAASRTDWPKHREALRKLLEFVQRLTLATPCLTDDPQFGLGVNSARAIIAREAEEEIAAIAATLGIEEDGDITPAFHLNR